MEYRARHHHFCSLSAAFVVATATLMVGCDSQTAVAPKESPAANGSATGSANGSATGSANGSATGSAPAPTAACAAMPDWFPNTPRPIGMDFQGTSNCAFHQWAWQMFLWLREPSSAEADAPLNFETMANPGDVLKPGGPTEPYPGRDPGEPPRLLARVAKSSDTVDADDIFQAGPGNRILVDQAGNVVYYTGLIDQSYWDFVTDHTLYELSSLQSIGADTDFDVDNLELKLSWRVAAELDPNGNPVKTYIPNADANFYTMVADVPVVEVVGGKVTDDTGKMQHVQLALVGIHVVGIVEDHPEFIWATFEHKANAPDCSAVPTDANEPTTGLPWSFYTPGSGIDVQNQFDVNQPLNVVSVCRQFPWGGGNAGNTSNIQSLNASVEPHLAGTVWANYELVGAVWTTGGNDIPGGNGAPVGPNDQQIGSLNLANTTMETFTQSANCFACHNGGVHTVTVGNSGQIVAAKHLNLSHFIVNYQASLQAMQGAD